MSQKLALALVLAAEQVSGNGPVNDYTTSPTSPLGFRCMEAKDEEADVLEDDHQDPFNYVIELTSPTTFGIHWHDGNLQKTREFHPLKCDINDGEQQWAGGRMLLLQNACFLKNSEDTESCFRKQYFKYPVDPDSPTVKHELRRRSDGLGFGVWPGNKVQVYNRSGTTTADMVRRLFPRSAQFEVCAHTGSCVPGQGLCQPAFWLVAEDWNYDPYEDAWSDMPSSSFRPHLDISEVAYDWNQVHHTPQYGPYPLCPEDELGRATKCVGNETLTIRVSSLEVKSATIEDNGQKVVFDVKFSLEWGDRYAVHPCTINLYRVRTSGKHLQVPSTRFWTPNLKAANEMEDTQVKYAASSLGVNLGFGQPVKVSVSEDTQIWPKQLVLSRAYQAQYFPEPMLDWWQYPYDNQTLKLVLADMSLAPGTYKFEVAPSAVNADDVDVGDEWKFESLEVGVVTEDDRSAISISVRMKRTAASKLYTLLYPALTFVCLDVMGHLIMPYDNDGELFMAQALMMGVSITMLDPDFLGFPATVSRMPYIQCFVLMLTVGTLKTALLLMGRLLWRSRINGLESRLEAGSDGKEGEEGPSVARRLEKLRAQRRIYDLFVKATVPLWYLVSLLAVSIAYNVL